MEAKLESKYIWGGAKSPIENKIERSRLDYIRRRIGKVGPDSDAVFRTYELMSSLGYIYGKYTIEDVKDLGRDKLGVVYSTPTKNFSLVIDLEKESEPTVTCYENEKSSTRI